MSQGVGSWGKVERGDSLKENYMSMKGVGCCQSGGGKLSYLLYGINLIYKTKVWIKWWDLRFFTTW